MEPWRFDLEQIRKNWERDADLPSNPLPQKFARVEAPRDPYREAEAQLERVRVHVRAEVPAHEAVLAPFFDEAAGIVRRLAAKAGHDGGRPPMPPGPAGHDGEEGEGEPVDKKKLLAELDRVLGDVEDMLALFCGIGWR